MPTKKRDHYHYKIKGKLGFLLGSLLLLLIIYPFLEDGKISQMIFAVLASLIPITGVYAVSHNRKTLFSALSFGIPFLIVNWLNTFYANPILYFLFIALSIVFYLYVVIVLGRYISRVLRVTGDTIYGAISIYLLVGIIWAFIFLLIESLIPGSFVIGTESRIRTTIVWSDFLYYSFSTLTTLGIGDIAPVSSQARAFSYLEAIFGVFFVAIMMTKLVALYIRASRD